MAGFFDCVMMTVNQQPTGFTIMASRGKNLVIIVGNLGQDPEIKFMPNGNAVCNISVATSESWKDQQGQLQERTEWHRIVMFKKLAEIAGQYLKKGSQVFIEGKLQTRKWQDQQGQDRYTTEIIADNMQMLGSRDNSITSASAQPPQQQAQGQQQPPQQYQQAPQQAQQQGQYQQAPQGQMAPPPMDDIPFATIGLQYPALLHCS